MGRGRLLVAVLIAIMGAAGAVGAAAEPVSAAAKRTLRPDPRLAIPAVAPAARREALLGAGRFRRRTGPLTFFIDATLGSDSNSGTSPGTAWRTLARADRARFIGGDQLLLRGGETFAGALRFTRHRVTSTSARAPLTIASYGTGTATILAGTGDGIRATSVAGFHITGLRLAGESTSCKPHTYGILFYAARSTGTLAAGISVDHVEVHGFCDGIAVGTGDDNSRFEHVHLTELSSHDNLDAGVFTFDPARSHHDVRDVFVSGVQAYDNAGIGGIALFGVEGGAIEHSVAHDNGRAGSGGVGIWAFDADHITIQFSESYDNRTVEGDGDGFDLDGGVSNSVMQYDYSHGNEGIGFLVCGCVAEYAMHDNVVRYNVSQNDGTNGQPSGFYLLGGEPLEHVEVFNNTFYSSAGAGPLALVEAGEHPYAEVHLRNNLLAESGAKPLLEVAEPAAASGLAVQGNDWWAASGAFDVQWGTSTFKSLAELRAGTGAETLAGTPVGASAAPEVCALGGGGTIYPLAPGELRAYELKPGSPLIGAGLDLAALFGTEVGHNDFGGDPPSRSGAFDIGADEHMAADAC
jgi:hypothetical protein